MEGRLVFPPRATVLRQLRARVRSIATGLGAESHVGDNLALVVDEIVNNAVEHGAAYRRQGLDLAIQIRGVGERLMLEFFDPEMPTAAVQDLAGALAAVRSGVPSLESERGRGLFLLSVYLDDLHAELAEYGGLRLFGHVARR